MKHTWKRALCVLLSLVMLLSLTVPTFAVEGQAQNDAPAVTWEKVEGTGRAIPNGIKVPLQTEPERDENEIVRVSIVLNEDSTLGKGYPTKSIADNANAMRYRDSLKAKQNALAEKISREILDGAPLDVVWNITLAGNIISANVPYGKLDAIRALDEVKSVVPEARYEAAVSVEEGDQPSMYRSTLQTGSDKVWEKGITGAGSRVAIIDTGVNHNHTSNAASPLDYSLGLDAEAKGMSKEAFIASLNLLTADEIAQHLDELNAPIDPSLAYLSTKVPYAYNYVDRDYDTTHANDSQGNHGSHVAGIAASNKYVVSGDGFAEAVNGSNKIKGQAYDAQIINMKVFGKNGGAYDSDYMVAIEDAIILGCDAANLSLGSSSAGFTTSEEYQSILDSLADSDIVVSISMGNAYQWSYAAGISGRTLYADDANYFTGGSPGSFANAFTVASVGGANYNANGRYTMSSFSSWGVPSDLSLKPEITAPGGSIVAVNGTNDSGFTSMSGTSMAAPQITGITALVAQYLRENNMVPEGMTPRKLAQSLIMSTAVPIHMTNNGYIVYPVIQQGAGLARVDKAISSKTFVIINPNSLPDSAPNSAKDNVRDGKVKVELGDDPDRNGVYSFSYVLANLTDEPVIYKLDAEFFTQNLTTSGGNRMRATTTAALSANLDWTVNGLPLEEVPPVGLADLTGDEIIDQADAQAILDFCAGLIEQLPINGELADLNADSLVNTYDAYLYLQALAENNAVNGYVTVPANGHVEIGLTFDVKDSIEAYDVKGNYVEGYVYAKEITSSDAEGVDHSIPVLGYYGSWTEPSMFNKGSYLDYKYGVETRTPYLNSVLDDARALQTYLIRYAGDEFGTPLGGNPVADDPVYHPERNAISSIYNDEIFSVHYSAIRNSAATRFRVLQEGVEAPLTEVLAQNVFGAYYNTNDRQWYNTNAMPDINYFLPASVENNAKLTLSFELAPEYYLNTDGSINWDQLRDGAKLTLPVTVDNEEPEVQDVRIAVSDVDGARSLLINASDNQYIASIRLLTPEGTVLSTFGSDPNATAGGSYYVIAPLSENYEKLLVEVTDYALNVGTYRLNFNKEELEEPEVTMTLDQTDFEIIGKNSVKLKASVLPWGVDDSVTWTTSDPEVATVNGRGVVTGVETGTAVITATSVAYPGLSASATVHVRFIEKTLNGIVCDENGASYVIEFNMRDLPTYTELHEEPLSDWVYETAIDRDGTVYVSTYDGSSQSPLYTLDLNTMELTQLGTGTSRTYYTDIDTVGDNLYGKNILVGVYSTNLYTINKANGSRASQISMRDYTGSGSLVGISFYKTVENVDHFFVLTQSGVVYDVGLYDNDGTVAVQGAEQVLNFGYTADTNYWQDLYYDGENLFWSRIDLGISRVDLIMAEGFTNPDRDTNIIRAGSFAVDVWPVGGLFELDKVPGYTRPDPDPEPGTPEDLVPDGSLTAAVLSDDIDAAEAGRSINILAEADNTNGLITVTYPETATLEHVDPSTCHAVKLEEGKVTLAYAFTAPVEKDTLIASLSFTSESYGTVLVTTTELNEEVMLPPITETVPLYPVDQAPELVYGEPVFSWSQDYSMATAAFTSLDGSDVKVLVCQVTSEGRAPTYEEDGITLYTATVEFNGVTYTDVKTVTLPALGYTYGAPTFQWAEDYSVATAVFAAIEDPENTVHLPAEITSEEVAPSCETPGKIIYTASVVFDGETFTDTKEVEIPATGHSYGAPVFIWSDDNSLVYAQFTCPICGKTEQVKAAVTAEATEPTYEADGKVIYTATVVFGNGTYAETRTVELPALQYTFGAPTFQWGEDNTAKAVFIANEDPSHLVEVEAAVTESSRLEPTCEAAGRVILTASVSFLGQNYREEKISELPALGHSYGAPVFTWADDCSLAHASFACERCGKTLTVQAEIATEVTPATEEAAGKTVYTASVTLDGSTYTDTKTMVIPPLSYTYGNPVFTWAEDCSSAVAVFTANEDPAKTITVEAEVRSEITEPTYDEAGQQLYLAVAVLEGKEYVDQKTVPIPAKGHPSIVFTDVNQNAWYRDGVDYVVEHNMMNGTSATLFNPSGTVNRAMMVTVLYRLAGEPSVEGLSNPFTDVPDGKYYTNAVIWANANNITNGTDSTHFSPTRETTREQLVTFLYRYAAFAGKDVSISAGDALEQYADGSRVGSFAKDAMRWASENGILTGARNSSGGLSLNPKDSATRAQLACIFARFAQNVEDAPATEEPKS